MIKIKSEVNENLIVSQNSLIEQLYRFCEVIDEMRSTTKKNNLDSKPQINNYLNQLVFQGNEKITKRI